MFACGPTFGMLLPLLALAAGTLTCLLSILSGLICVFCSQAKLGAWLIGIPLAIAGLGLAVFVIFFS